MQHVQIKMLTIGPTGRYTPGEVKLVDKVRAAVLVAGSHAEYFKPAVETAEAPAPPENAMMPRPRRKRVSKDVSNADNSTRRRTGGSCNSKTAPAR